MLATVVMMVGPPGVPRTSQSLPSFNTMVGVMADSGRLFGPTAFASPWMRPNMLGAPGLEEKSSISLLSRKPSEPAVTFEPKLPFRVVVTATALPSTSTTE